MVTDNQLLDEVRAVLHADVAEVAAPAALLSAVHRRYRRRRGTRRWLVATAAAASAVAAMTLPPATGNPPATEHPPVAESSPAEQSPPVNAAHVAASTTAALNEVTDDVIHERATVTKGDKYSEPGEEALYERWLAADGSSFRLLVTIGGEPVVDLSRDAVSDVFVDHRVGTYRVFPGMEPNPPQYDDVWTPKEIQEALATGDLAVVGPADPIDGNPAILLHRDTRKAEVPMNLWVDATTYLPVRWQWEQENSTPFDVTYLPPTPENRAKLTTVVPPGFKEEK